jgi:hypothetical protein
VIDRLRAEAVVADEGLAWRDVPARGLRALKLRVPGRVGARRSPRWVWPAVRARPPRSGPSESRSCSWIGAVCLAACRAARSTRGSGKLGIVVDPQDEVGEFLRECCRLVGVAMQAVPLVRAGLRDARDDKVVKTVLERGELLGGIGISGFVGHAAPHLDASAGKPCGLRRLRVKRARGQFAPPRSSEKRSHGPEAATALPSKESGAFPQKRIFRQSSTRCPTRTSPRSGLGVSLDLPLRHGPYRFDASELTEYPASMVRAEQPPKMSHERSVRHGAGNGHDEPPADWERGSSEADRRRRSRPAGAQWVRPPAGHPQPA